MKQLQEENNKITNMMKEAITIRSKHRKGKSKNITQPWHNSLLDKQHRNLFVVLLFVIRYFFTCLHTPYQLDLSEHTPQWNLNQAQISPCLATDEYAVPSSNETRRLSFVFYLIFFNFSLVFVYIKYTNNLFLVHRK